MAPVEYQSNDDSGIHEAQYSSIFSLSLFFRVAYSSCILSWLLELLICLTDSEAEVVDDDEEREVQALHLQIEQNVQTLQFVSCALCRVAHAAIEALIDSKFEKYS